MWRALTHARQVVADLEQVWDAMASAAFSDRLIGSHEVHERSGFKRATLRAQIAAGKFPAPIERTSAKSRRRWRESEVDAYVKGEWKPRPKE